LAQSDVRTVALPYNKATSEANATRLPLKAYMRAMRSSSSLGIIVEASARGEALGVGSIGLWIGSVHIPLGGKASGNLNNSCVWDEGIGWDVASCT
jgi:hypothetical protein